jgi:hypothetical protein
VQPQVKVDDYRQARALHLSHTPGPFCFSLFSDRSPAFAWTGVGKIPYPGLLSS